MLVTCAHFFINHEPYFFIFVEPKKFSQHDSIFSPNLLKGFCEKMVEINLIVKS